MSNAELKTQNGRIDILGVGFDALTFGGALERAVRLTESGGYCVTPNPEIVLLVRRDEEFRSAVNGAELVIADGIGVIRAAGILGRPLPEKIPGIDLAEAVIARLAASPDNRGVFLFGAKPGVAELAAERLTERYPGLKIAGLESGYGYDEAEVMRRISAENPALALVCLGMRRQEMFMARYRAGQTSLFMGLGGALDAFAGTVARAPEGWRKLGLEWLYRLIRQPSRFGRMIKLPLILLLALRERMFKC
jgi:N-acetylglucosaminyldiphosphoundecaprenol N-acetyl-beta-D-mannosaminyltransferase